MDGFVSAVRWIVEIIGVADLYMLRAGILPGDLVVVHRQQECRSGEIVVALFEDEATVKTLRRKDGKTWLMPENPDYEPIDGTFAQILGKVVAVVRRY